MVIGEGGVLLYRTSHAVSGSVRNSLKVDALMPSINDVLSQQLSRIMGTAATIQRRAAQGQYLSAEHGSITTLLDALGDLCHELAEVATEIEDALHCQSDGEPDTAAYLLTRAKATMLGTPV